MKKKILLAAALAICLAVAASGTLAYFTSGDAAHNVITTGGVKIAVVEKMQSEDGVLVDFPKEGMRGVMPGSDISKIVRVENTGESEAWIRVKVEAKITSADNEELPVDVMHYEIGENWHMDFDGFLYYAKPVAPGESTEMLFDTVRFAPEMGNAYQNCTANIWISAQAVQTANNGETVLEAQGWPAGE